MQVTELIGHPELLNRDTLYELRRVVGQCPYYHAARLLLVENLFLLHDPDFDEQLKQAAAFVPDPAVLFDLVESINYEVPADSHAGRHDGPEPTDGSLTATTGNRTLDLIGQFLQTVGPSEPTTTHKRKVLDPISDYMSVIEEMEDAETTTDTAEIPTFNHAAHSLASMPEPTEGPAEPESEEKSAEQDEPIRQEYFTETLAKVFVKQGNYERAIEILTKLNEESPRKNAYFNDQIRFLRKLVAANH